MPAIKHLSFTVERGECVAILGQNGSGKSTMIRLLSTLLLHDGGTARIFGHDVFAESRVIRRLVNRVSVEASFFKEMSASENLAYAARILQDFLDRVGHRLPPINAVGPVAFDLSDVAHSRACVDRVLRVLRDGRMPPWGGVLSPIEIKELWAYIHSNRQQ